MGPAWQSFSVQHDMKIAACIILALALALSASSAEENLLGGQEMKKLAKGAVELGWKYFNEGDHETALRRFEMAARHDKAFAPAYFGMAYVYSAQGRLDDAIKYYRESLKYDQSYPYTFANLGYALLQKEQFDESLKMLDKALQLDPKCGEAHLSYANYFARKKEWKKAEESANKAIDCAQKLHPNFRKLLEENGAKLKAEPRSAPNVSQSSRSDTNRTPSAAGSRR
jgi:Tfp pilus assembly protein PilF